MRSTRQATDWAFVLVSNRLGPNLSCQLSFFLVNYLSHLITIQYNHIVEFIDLQIELQFTHLKVWTVSKDCRLFQYQMTISLMKINPISKILGNKIKITPKFKYINHNLVLNLIFLREDNIIFIALVNIILQFNSIVKPK